MLHHRDKELDRRQTRQHTTAIRNRVFCSAYQNDQIDASGVACIHIFCTVHSHYVSCLPGALIVDSAVLFSCCTANDDDDGNNNNE